MDSWGRRVVGDEVWGIIGVEWGSQYLMLGMRENTVSYAGPLSIACRGPYQSKIFYLVFLQFCANSASKSIHYGAILWHFHHVFATICPAVYRPHTTLQLTSTVKPCIIYSILQRKGMNICTNINCGSDLTVVR